MSTHVFVGPTIKQALATRYLDAHYHPPAQQGDILRVLADRPSAILIIDGYFQFVPSVWHKEILMALEAGVAVYGAASMGALRAAELEPFGMIGIGQVFRWFQTGELQDDDEVAMIHADGEYNFTPLSEALVNMRHVCESAAARSLIDRKTAARILEIAKQLHYSKRQWPAVENESERVGVSSGELCALSRFRRSLRYNLKQRDAIEALRLLARVRQPQRPRRVSPVRVERTVFLDALACEVELERRGRGDDEPDALDVARKKVLLGILATRELGRLGIAPGRGRIQQVTDWFLKAYDVPGGAAADVWLAARGITRSAFEQAMERFTAIVEMQEHFALQIERELPAYSKLHSGRKNDDPAAWTQINVSLERVNGMGAADSARELFRLLLPVLTKDRRSLGIESFHFTRKTPDVRLRFLSSRTDRLTFRIDRMLRRKRSGVELAFSSVYEPEERLFGGPPAMHAVHRYFEEDSLLAIRWLVAVSPDGRSDPAAMCFRVVDDLFERVLEGGSEVWDAWTLVQERAVAGGGPDPAVADLGGSLPAPQAAILRSYRRANGRLADACLALWRRGALGLGLRGLVAYVAMFHFNRYGLDGTAQARIARFAIARRDPTLSAARCAAQ